MLHLNLQVNRSLLPKNFDGYKLSLQNLPLYSKKLQVPASQTKLSDDQQSRLHHEITGKQNLLTYDPWERQLTYYVNNLNQLIRCTFDEDTNSSDVRIQTEFSSYTDENDIDVDGKYNYTIFFISEKYCLICNGVRSLYLFDTGNRRKCDYWTLLAKDQIQVRINNDDDECNFLIYDGRLQIINEKKRIALALASVGRIDGKAKMFIHIAYWSLDDNKQWILNIDDTLETQNSIQYCAFDPSCNGITVVASNSIAFRSKKSTETMNVDKQCERPHLGDGTDEKPLYDYEWQQDESTTTIIFDLENKIKTNYKINTNGKRINVCYGDQTLLDGEIFGGFITEATTWSFKMKKLEIYLLKDPENVQWTNLLLGDDAPPETNNGDIPNLPSKPIVNLDTPIEDCDLIDENDDDNKFIRFDLTSKEITQAFILNTTPPLFTTILRPNYPPALVLRHDHDASVWLQRFNANDDIPLKLYHEGTLPAFAYILASKTLRKFFNCSPDLSFAVIVEHQRHIFIYKMKNESADGLRNRNGTGFQIGKQHVLTLPTEFGYVVGGTVSNDLLTILTSKEIIYIKLSTKIE